MIEEAETYIRGWTTLLESPELRSFRKGLPELLFSTTPPSTNHFLFYQPKKKTNLTFAKVVSPNRTKTGSTEEQDCTFGL